MIRVAVLMGGRSSEHEISVASAQSVLAALDPDLDSLLNVNTPEDYAAARARPGQALRYANTRAVGNLASLLGARPDVIQSPLRT